MFSTKKTHKIWEERQPYIYMLVLLQIFSNMFVIFNFVNIHGDLLEWAASTTIFTRFAQCFLFCAFARIFWRLISDFSGRKLNSLKCLFVLIISRLIVVTILVLLRPLYFLLLLFSKKYFIACLIGVFAGNLKTCPNSFHLLSVMSIRRGLVLVVW